MVDKREFQYSQEHTSTMEGCTSGTDVKRLELPKLEISFRLELIALTYAQTVMKSGTNYS